MSQYCFSLPWSPEQLAAWSTFGLFAIALPTAIIALLQYCWTTRDKAFERTLRQIDAWYQRQGDAMSPEGCYAYLNKTYGGNLTALKALAATDPACEKARECFFTLHNYFFDAIFLANRDQLDLDSFLSHQETIVRSVWAILRDYYTLFEAQEGLQLAGKPPELLIAALDRKRHR